MSDVPHAAAVVAAFEPFGGRRRNRSWDVARALAAQRDLRCVCLPVNFRTLPDAVARLVENDPPALLLLGEGPGRRVRVEQLALNVQHATRADNAGFRPEGETLIAGAPPARVAAWDATAIAGRMRRLGVAAEPSFHAGTFACNAAYYVALGRGPSAVGFVHVPRRRWPAGPRLGVLLAAASVALDALLADNRADSGHQRGRITEESGDDVR